MGTAKNVVKEDKENNVKYQIFKNKNIKGKEYLICKLWFYAYPFKYNRSIAIKMGELESLKTLLSRMPKMEIKKKEK